jgi:hypothetical protein
VGSQVYCCCWELFGQRQLSRNLGNLDHCEHFQQQRSFCDLFQCRQSSSAVRQLINIAGMSNVVGVLIGLGIGRVWIYRREAVAVFAAGGLVSGVGFMFFRL